jgi:hypothetical protein
VPLLGLLRHQKSHATVGRSRSSLLEAGIVTWSAMFEQTGTSSEHLYHHRTACTQHQAGTCKGPTRSAGPEAFSRRLFGGIIGSQEAIEQSDSLQTER